MKDAFQMKEIPYIQEEKSEEDDEESREWRLNFNYF